MDITRLSYSQKDLEALPEAQLSAFLLIGHFLTEANWLRKLILISTLDQSGIEPEEKARLGLSLMLANLSASKIHAGWMRLTTFAKDLAPRAGV